MEATDSLVSRVQKHIEGLKARNNKLVEENARLKQQLAELKATTSRIRRIPRKPSADSGASPAAEVTQA